MRHCKPLTHLLERLGPALPTGLFSSEQVHHRLARIFSQDGRSNDFRRLGTRLSLVATDLDTGEAVAFGGPGWDHVPISRAVQASSALPGLFPPVEIDGRSFVDGVLQKTMHASVALEGGVDLMLCINPLVPFRASGRGIPRLAQAGLPAVLSQALRSLIHSRLELRMREYARSYPATDILLFEPEGSDPALYLANTFGYRDRGALAEHAYQQTRALLQAQQETLAPRLGRHGITLRIDRLVERRTLLGQRAQQTGMGAALAELRATLDTLDHRLQRA
jgi:predicted acylesterase/phospholipase RssA